MRGSRRGGQHTGCEREGSRQLQPKVRARLRRGSCKQRRERGYKEDAGIPVSALIICDSLLVHRRIRIILPFSLKQSLWTCDLSPTRGQIQSQLKNSHNLLIFIKGLFFSPDLFSFIIFSSLLKKGRPLRLRYPFLFKTLTCSR